MTEITFRLEVISYVTVAYVRNCYVFLSLSLLQFSFCLVKYINKMGFDMSHWNALEEMKFKCTS